MPILIQSCPLTFGGPFSAFFWTFFEMFQGSGERWHLSQPKSHKCLKKKLDNFSNLFVKISKLRCEDAVSLTIICERCEACQGGSCGQRRDIKEDPAVSRQSAWPPLKMIKTLLVCFLLYSQAFASPVPAEDTEAGERVDRGLLEDLLDCKESRTFLETSRSRWSGTWSSTRLMPSWGSPPPPPRPELDWWEAVSYVLQRFKIKKIMHSCLL